MISSYDKETLQTIYRQLIPMSTSEGYFTGMENLFYMTLQLARSYGNNQDHNQFLKDLMELKEDVYKETQKMFSKRAQRELTILHFKRAFKKKLAMWIK